MNKIILDNLEISDLTEAQLEKLNYETLSSYAEQDPRIEGIMLNAFNKPEDLAKIREPRNLIYYFNNIIPNVRERVEALALQATTSDQLAIWVDHLGEKVLERFLDLSMEENYYERINYYFYKKNVGVLTDRKWLEYIKTIDKNKAKTGRKALLNSLVVLLDNSLVEELCEIVAEQNGSVPASYMLVWRDDIPEKYHEAFARAYAAGAKNDGWVKTKIDPKIIEEMAPVSRFNFLERTIGGLYPFTKCVRKEQVQGWLFATTFKFNEETNKIVKKFDKAYYEERQKQMMKRYAYGNNASNYNYLSAEENSWNEADKLEKYVGVADEETKEE